MRIRAVEPIPVAYPEPNDFGARRHLCLVKITTDQGLTGWGEAVTMWPEASLATAAIISGMAELLVDESLDGVDRHWRRLKDHAWWYGYGGGLASFAIAALDIALWDLWGKSLDVGVLDLLGGRVHDRLPAIASAHAHHEPIPQMAEEAAGWLAGGFKGMKVGFGKRGNARLGYEHSRDVAYVAAMREVLGPDRDLMIDLGVAIRWDVTEAVQRTRAFDDYGIAWIEEPLGAWDPEGYRTLRAKTTTRIAYGEKEWSLEGYRRVLDTGTVDVVGVDPGRAEGVTGFRRIADAVEQCGRQVNAHTWSSAIVSAASLALSFASPAAHLLEFKPLKNPMQHELVAEPIEQRDGWVSPPTGPGLGIDVVEDVVAHYRYTG